MRSTIGDRIEQELLNWQGVSTGPHRFGGKEFCVNRREMGHIHGNTLVDFPFPLQLRKELVSSGRVSLHHVLPESGWASYWIKDDAKFEEIIELFRIQYERLKSKERQPFERHSLNLSSKMMTQPNGIRVFHGLYSTTIGNN
jgi:hypothetical protein